MAGCCSEIEQTDVRNQAKGLFKGYVIVCVSWRRKEYLLGLSSVCQARDQKRR